MCCTLSVDDHPVAQSQEPLDPTIQKIVDFLSSHPHRVAGIMMFLGINRQPLGRPALKSEQMFKK